MVRKSFIPSYYKSFMVKLYFIFAISFIFILSLSFVSSNFACGFVNNSKQFSSSWSNVVIYKAENTSNVVPCKINPESKFCCDLEEIRGAKFKVGEKISAELFDEKSGFVAGPVSLFLTGEGYDIFPQLNLEKAIIINSPNESIFINESLVYFNLTLAEGYNNLNYSINSFDGIFQYRVCNSCINPIFTVNLSKGKNEIILTAYGPRSISEKIVLYNLDYLDFKMGVICDKCKIKGDIFYVPSGKNITFSSSFNSSHNISGDFLFYFPADFNYFNISEIGDIGPTSKFLAEEIIDKKQYSVNYTFQSPTTFIKKEYPFYQKMGNLESLNQVMVYRYLLIPLHKSKYFERGYFNEALTQKGSPDEPIILNSKQDYLDIVAIFPNKEILKSYSSIHFDVKKKGRNKEYSFTIISNIPKKYMDRIFLVFMVEKSKPISVYSGKNKLQLDFYEEDSNYTYYSTFVHEKGPFTVKFS
jgi:hypothetical protein